MTTMTAIRTPANAISIFIMFLVMLAANFAAAQDQPFKRTELLRSDLADFPGKKTVIYVADVAPGGEGTRHTHYGDEYVYILEGTLTITLALYLDKASHAGWHGQHQLL